MYCHSPCHFSILRNYHTPHIMALYFPVGLLSRSQSLMYSLNGGKRNHEYGHLVNMLKDTNNINDYFITSNSFGFRNVHHEDYFSSLIFCQSTTSRVRHLEYTLVVYNTRPLSLPPLESGHVFSSILSVHGLLNSMPV